VVLLVLVAIIGLAWWAMHRTPAVHYVTAPAERGAITRNIAATGTVNPVLTIIVGAYDSGVIQNIYCDYNTQVKAAQVCAKIDPRPLSVVRDFETGGILI
jgi:HlyD family secretion protein